ncbi:MAG TPA: hypothetical protein O0X27_04690 [Methanocorpusculum sp.]|nr:hypothetical protein [Methanocorpusculum sp.]
MTGESYTTRPVGKIITRGRPLMSAEKVLLESAKAGMLVTCDGNDYKAKKCTANTRPVGWISYEDTDYKVRPSDYETPFVSGDPVTIVNGGTFQIYALATAGTEPLAITIGDYLTSNDDGTLTRFVPNTASPQYPPVAIAVESVTIPAGTVGRVHANSLI